jgi:hypothetical protein
MTEKPPSGVPFWIKALAALAVLALLANGVFIWLSLKGRRDLVRQDYYQAGLEQDARLARRALAAAHSVELAAEGGEWVVRASRLPGIPAATGQAGAPPATEGVPSPEGAPSLEGAACRISFQRPEDGREDRAAELAWAGGTTTEGVWRGPAAQLRKGLWNILIEWERDGKVFMESAFPRTFGE